MKYVVIVAAPLLLFAGLFLALDWVTEVSAREHVAQTKPTPDPEARRLDRAKVQLALRYALASLPPPRPARPAVPPGLLGGASMAGGEAPAPPDPRVPRHLNAPLRAVAPDISLCVPHWLERDKGPIDVTVRFTPVAGGGFAPGTQVSTTWGGDEVAKCIEEVFEETTFLPDAESRFEPSEYVFHFPDDEHSGLLGLTYSPFR